MNAADARDALENGDAADRLHALRWMREHTPTGQEGVVVSDQVRDGTKMIGTPRGPRDCKHGLLEIKCEICELGRLLSEANASAIKYAKEADILEAKLANAESCGAAGMDAFRLASTLADIRQAHLDAMKKELAAMRERAEKAEAARDEARNALRNIKSFVIEDYYPNCVTVEFEAAIKQMNAALGEVAR